MEDFPGASETGKRWIEKKDIKKCLNGHELKYKEFTDTGINCDLDGKSIEQTSGYYCSGDRSGDCDFDIC